MTIFSSKPIRIAYCEGNNDGTIGGSYFSLLFLVESLDRTRFDPLVIFRRAHALIPRFQRAADVHLVPPRSPVRRRWSVLQSAVNFLRFLLTSVDQARFLRRHRVELLHLNNSVTRNHDWMLAAMLAGVPCMTHERGLNPDFPRTALVLGARLRAVICISQAVRDHLVAKGLAQTRLHVVHNGLDPAALQPSRTAAQFRTDHNLPPASRMIGMIGNIKPWKGQELVIRALPAIVRRFPDTICLFVGDVSREDLEYDRRLRGLIRELGLEQQVVFTGYLANPADALNVMEVAIHASIAPEPFGRVLLEAMAIRRPLVASRAGAVPEIVIDGVTGYTFRPGDADELADRVMALLADPDTGRTFGEAGYQRVMREFHLRRNVERTLEIYARVLGLAAGGPRPPGEGRQQSG